MLGIARADAYNENLAHVAPAVWATRSNPRVADSIGRRHPAVQVAGRAKDLATRQKLNVTAFLTSGIVGAHPGLLGEPYEDATGNRYNALSIQPVIVLAAEGDPIATIYRRALERGVKLSLYIRAMFSTGHDAANRATVKQYAPDAMDVVGPALRDDKRLVDKITEGARMHP